MTAEPIVKTVAEGLNKTGHAPVVDAIDPRQRAIALGLEFTKKCFEAQTVDDAYFLFTNDIRALLPFDRSILISHLGGRSSFVAAGNQPTLETKSRYFQQVNELGEALVGLDKAVLVSGAGSLGEQDLPDKAREALEEFRQSTRSSHIFCVPLAHNRRVVAHLILEFLDETRPDQLGILTVLNIAPFLAAALAEKWLFSKKPALAALLDPTAAAEARTQRFRRLIPYVAIAASCLLCFFFVFPFPFDVGGEAEVVPTDRHLAFCKIEGLIDRVNVAEGSQVQKEQVLATLDPRELDYKVKAAEKQFEILTSEMTLLRSSAGEDPSKLAESALVALKRKAAWEEVRFLKWQRQFLEIRSPVPGILLTKDIESLSGKKLRPGEPFCEVATPGGLSVEVLVPEDRVTYVKKGQVMVFFLSGSPWKGHWLKVSEVLPMAEATPRLGNVYRVRALFPDAPASTMVGMKGVGKIHVKNASLWFIVSERVLSRWQRFSLNFM